MATPGRRGCTLRRRAPHQGRLDPMYTLLPSMTRSLATVALLSAVGCGPEPDPPPVAPAGWTIVHEDLPGALLSIWGTSARDVWAVGGDARDGTGPLVVHYDGAGWTRVPTGLSQGNLWWVFGFAGGPIYFGGDGATVLRYEGGAFTQLAAPTTAGTVFGIWGASPDDMWAVGGTVNKNGFAWRLEGDSWEPEPTVPAAVVADAAIWKMFGTSASDAWLVGSAGVSFHWDGSALTQIDTGVTADLFTVHANGERAAAVGGFGTGYIVENAGDGWTTALAPATYGLTGIFLGDGDNGFAVGQYGLMYRRDAAGWQEEDNELALSEDLHAAWIDPSGGAWAVGGQISSALVNGILLHKGDPVATGGI
jgi:hypothetical protein